MWSANVRGYFIENRHRTRVFLFFVLFFVYCMTGIAPCNIVQHVSLSSGVESSGVITKEYCNMPSPYRAKYFEST